MSDRTTATRGWAVGLTGGIACGKSEVGRILEGLGAAVRDADDISHALMEPGRPLYAAVVKRFGQGIVGVGGAIDRRILGAGVFADPAERKALEAIVHPEVIRVLRDWVRTITGAGRVAVGIVPLLFEVGAEGLWDTTVCVISPESAVMERLLGRGLTAADARARLASQMPPAEKAARATYVIENNGTRPALEKRVRKLWNRISKEEASHHARSQNEQG
jgi:dephospho-CoA kinase